MPGSNFIVVADAKDFLTGDVDWADPAQGNADIDNQRWSLDDCVGMADEDYGEGTGYASVALFDRMAKEAEKGNMRPTQAELDAAAAAAVSSGC